MSRLNFDNAFVRDLPGDPEQGSRQRQVLGAVYSRVHPTPVAAPRVVAWSAEMAQVLGWDAADLESPELAQVLGGNALLEGMAAGLPMIATDVGGNSEALEDGVSGVVVPARDPRRLADAILHLARDADLRKRIGTAACERVSRSFTLEACVQSYDLFYRGLLSGQRPGDIAHVQIR